MPSALRECTDCGMAGYDFGRLLLHDVPGIACPRIVKLEKALSLAGNPSQFLQYRPRYPCVESRKEALRIHDLARIEDEQEDVASTKWIRRNNDVVRIRDLDFCSSEDGYLDNQDDQWNGRPSGFEHIEAFTISYDVLLPKWQRPFFGFAISSQNSGHYHRYKMNRAAVKERQALALNFTPPFKAVEVNIRYGKDTEDRQYRTGPAPLA
ncbi:hypothetical protein BDZ45DRAFT_689419 [Acephala macrosclerotiorum]|nr:hypothetical protein BDZ45DRAFT_689419 [Acephala macrosclerotiorum]